MDDLIIIEAATTDHYNAAKALMIEYRDTSLADDYVIGGSGLNEELQQFPGLYVPPKGGVYLAYVDGQPCGCLALRQHTQTAGEVMRMHVKPVVRGRGIAEQLMRTLMQNARAMGYTELFLDSLNRFKPAHRLYERLGFTYCEPYDPHTNDLCALIWCLCT
jgi:putative acetyltransferase